MGNTTNLNISLVAQNQAQKEVTVNEAISTIDAILNRGVVHNGTNTPPVSPNEGDLYIVGASPTGDWSGKAGKLAYYNTTWKFITPNEGMTIWVNDEDTHYTYNGSAWAYAGVHSLDDLSDVAITSIATNQLLQYNGTNFVNTANIDNLGRVGVNATADSTNKLAVKSDAVLFDNNGASSQVKVNKNASGDTASHIFQDNYSGRAEFGLIADDNFQLKVSYDGSSWSQSFVVDKANGNIDFKQALTFDGAVTANSSITLGMHQLITPEIKNYAETLTSANSSTAYTIDLNNGNIFAITMTGNCTFTFSNPPASGKGGSFTLIQLQDGTGGRTTTWPTSVKWSGSNAPALATTANAVNILAFVTIDGGATWYGFIAGVDMR